MAGTNPVGTWEDADHTSQTGTAYKIKIDNDLIVGKRIADCFAPHAKTAPDMNVLVDIGAVFVDGGLVEKTQQTVGPITAPATNPRIDRIVYDSQTGVASVVAGTEAGSPVPPAIPEGKQPCAQVALVVGQTSITNANITDERIGGSVSGVVVIDKQVVAQTVANQAAETTVYSKSIAGGMLGTLNALRLTFNITDLDMPVSATLNIRIKYGGTTLINFTLTTGACETNSNEEATVVFLLRARNSTSLQRGEAFIRGSVTQGFDWNTAAGYDQGTASVDSTSAQNLVVSFDWDNATASRSATFGEVLLEKIA